MTHTEVGLSYGKIKFTEKNCPTPGFYTAVAVGDGGFRIFPLEDTSPLDRLATVERTKTRIRLVPTHGPARNPGAVPRRAKQD